MSNEEIAVREEFVCIECFQSIKSIFKIYQDGFKDIIQCPKCGEIVDSYIECENSVVFIDLVLFQTKAYAHILINKEIKSWILIKLMVSFLLCDAYLQWFHDKNQQFESIRSNNQQLFYALEYNFYFMLIKSLISYIIYATIIILVCYFDSKWGKVAKEEFPLSMIHKSLVLSSFGKMIVIPLVIWNPIAVYFNLAIFFTNLSNMQALRVATKMGQLKAASVVLISTSLVHLFNSIIDLSNLHN